MTTYTIKLSDKSEIPIDPEEVSKVIAALSTGSIGVMKRGIFNPSFFVCLVEDERRMERWREEQPNWNSVNKGKPLEPLKDIFEKLDIKQLQ